MGDVPSNREFSQKWCRNWLFGSFNWFFSRYLCAIETFVTIDVVTFSVADSFGRFTIYQQNSVKTAYFDCYCKICTWNYEECPYRHRHNLFGSFIWTEITILNPSISWLLSRTGARWKVSPVRWKHYVDRRRRGFGDNIKFVQVATQYSAENFLFCPYVNLLIYA